MIFVKIFIKIIIVIIHLILFVSCSNYDNSIVKKEIVLRLEPKVNNPRNSEGDFIKLKDGRILFIYTHFTDGSGDNSSAYLAGRYSSDRGRTWDREDTIILPNEGGMNIMSVSLIRLDEDRIALFYMRKNSETDCIPLMRISVDEAKSWSEATECITDVPGYYVMNNDRVVKLENGRILLPLALHRTPEDEGSDIGIILCYYSDDLGKSWMRGIQIKNPQKAVTQEPGVVELNNSRLLLFCRTSSGTQFLSYSDDQAITWTPLRPSNIKSPLSPASLERIPSTGDLLLVWNNNYAPDKRGGRRTPLNLAISNNEGESWSKIKTLENDIYGWYCYTAIDFVEDYILLGHCAGDTKNYGGLETTQITRLSLDWVYQDGIESPVVSYDKNGSFKLSATESNAKIYYTLDGSSPTVSSNLYRGEEIKVGRSTILNMFATTDGDRISDVISTYVGKDIYIPSMVIDNNVEPGLFFKYFNGSFGNTSDLNDRYLVKSGISEAFSLDHRDVDTDFGFIYDGLLEIPEDNLYTFYTISNDGSILKIDDTILIDNDGLHGESEVSAPISLRKGFHKILVKYIQAGGDKKLNVLWSSANISKSDIPSSVLFH